MPVRTRCAESRKAEVPHWNTSVPTRPTKEWQFLHPESRSIFAKPAVQSAAGRGSAGSDILERTRQPAARAALETRSRMSMPPGNLCHPLPDGAPQGAAFVPMLPAPHQPSPRRRAECPQLGLCISGLSRGRITQQRMLLA